MGIDINLYRACIGMFNAHKFSSKLIIIYSFYFLFMLLILLLYHFLKSLFTSFIIVTHRRSLNTIFFIFQSTFYIWHIGTMIFLSGDIEKTQGLLLITLKALKFATGILIAYQLTTLLPSGFTIMLTRVT